MNTTLIITQIRREFWENKVGLVYAPFAISAVFVVLLFIAAIKFGAGNTTVSSDLHFNWTSSSVSKTESIPDGGTKTVEIKETIEYQAHTDEVTDAPKTGAPSADQSTEEKTDSASAKKANSVPLSQAIVHHENEFFSGVVMAAVYVNSLILAVLFVIVLASYAHKCLFDDRKNRDILFWRSMPVSELLNVSVKAGVCVLVAPLTIFIANVFVAIVVLLLGSALFLSIGISFGVLMSAIFSTKLLTILFGIFSGSLLLMIVLLPVIGFIFLASAYAKRSPFVLSSMVPIALLILDKLLAIILGIHLHIQDLFASYSHVFSSVQPLFDPHVNFSLSMSSTVSYLLCVLVGALFISGTVWLRNNRYEI